MRALSHVEPIHPSQLTDADVALWDDIMRGRPDLKGPYFDIRYVRAVGAIVPQAYVARLYDEEEVAGYFAYQKRGGTIMALGAPLTDYHGIVSRPDLEIDFAFLLKGLKAHSLELQGWLGAGPETQGVDMRVTSSSRLADLSGGFEAYLARQTSLHHKFYKNLRRIRRNAEADFGGFAFSFEAVTPDLLEWVIGLKREQYQRSGLHDVFGCGWTLELLRQLAGFQDKGFGLRIGVHREGETIVAAEICLIRGDYMHMWFPAFDPAYSRYAPGIWLALDMMQHANGFGVKYVDFGYGSEAYKDTLTEPAHLCAEGHISYGAGAVLGRAFEAVLERVPASERILGIRQSVRRRLNIIRACETNIRDQLRAFQSLGERAVSRLRAAKMDNRKPAESETPPSEAA
jgi:CelD/BcsL family acetyltransferase involved in cellulose biosynthesis